MEEYAGDGPVDLRTLGGSFSGFHDVEPAASIPGALTIRVRTSKTNRDGEATDVRLAKNSAAAALTALRPANAAPEALVFRGLNGQSIGWRFAAAAKSAGVEGVTAHSGRVGLASELTAAGASTTETMLAGGWKTARMVAHYSAGAVTSSIAAAAKSCVVNIVLVMMFPQ